MEGNVTFHERYWKNVSAEGMTLAFAGVMTKDKGGWLINVMTSAKQFVKRLLNPNPDQRPTAMEVCTDPVRTPPPFFAVIPLALYPQPFHHLVVNRVRATPEI